MSRPFVSCCALLLLHSCFVPPSSCEDRQSGVRDLTVLVSPRMPCVWPVGMMPHVVMPTRQFGTSPCFREMVIIDEHTGTQWDAPAHFIPPPESGLPEAGPTGSLTGDKVPVWQFAGEACLIDLQKHVDDAADGSSFLITPEMVQAWEKEHRALGPGDVVLFRSGYTDRYYQPLPAGERLVHAPLRGQTPAWPGPTPQTMKYLGEKGVRTAGIDSPSMGPLPDLAAATHQAGARYGMIWTEMATQLRQLPATGAAYLLFAAKHANGSGSEARAVGVTDPQLAARLIASARDKRVADLSVLLDESLPVTWPGARPGDEAPRYVATALNRFNPARGPFFALTHTLDSQVGTHLVPPSYSLPPPGFDANQFAPEIRRQVDAFEEKYGPLGRSDLTVEKVPLDVLIGDAHPIDVRSLIGTTAGAKGVRSPRITLELVKNHERTVRPIQAGEIVLFHSGYSDEHFQPLPNAPAKDRLMAAPLAGEAEGWPAIEPAVIEYLAEKKIRCLGTDGPTLGGVDPQHAQTVYWLAATRGLQVIEFLTKIDQLPQRGAIFAFAPIKIEGTHGGYGRALGFY
jgi:kynurenine formamidase